MLFEMYMYSDNSHFKYARGKPTLSGREFHEYDEILLFLGGNSQVISKSVQLTLTPGTVVLIPREHFHQFFVTDQNNYLRAIVGFSLKGEACELAREIMDDVRVIPSPTEHLISLFNSLMRASEQDLAAHEQKILLDSTVIQILFELKMSARDAIDKSISASEPTLRALEYIDEHYAEDIGLEGIARMLNVSASSLSHKFKRELNISVYRYITEKRLSEVRKLVEGGESLSRAAEACGFRDYSGFFRLYKKQYGICPSAISARERKQ